MATLATYQKRSILLSLSRGIIIKEFDLSEDKHENGVEWYAGRYKKKIIFPFSGGAFSEH
jgi:hypothetical protein